MSERRHATMPAHQKMAEMRGTLKFCQNIRHFTIFLNFLHFLLHSCWAAPVRVDGHCGFHWLTHVVSSDFDSDPNMIRSIFEQTLLLLAHRMLLQHVWQMIVSVVHSIIHSFNHALVLKLWFKTRLTQFVDSHSPGGLHFVFLPTTDPFLLRIFLLLLRYVTVECENKLQTFSTGVQKGTATEPGTTETPLFRRPQHLLHLLYLLLLC